MASIHLAGLSLRDLEYALAVSEQLHFGRAAAQCGVSQPGLSEQIRKLESLLGTPLFERGRGGVEITASGRPLLQRIGVIVREARGLMEMAGSQTGALNGRIDLGVIPTLGPYYVPLVLRALRDRFPQLELRLQEQRTDRLLDDLSRFRLDAALVALPLAQDGYATRPLFFEPFEVLLPDGHPLAGTSRIALRQLEPDALLLLEEGHCLRDQAVSLCHVRLSGRSPEAPRFAASLEMLRHMVAAGEGYCLMPALATLGDGALGGLVRVRPLADPKAGRAIGLVWRDTDPRAPDFERLAALLRQNAPSGTAVIPD